GLSGANPPRSPCLLVAITSDDPDALTLGALRGIYTADVVLHDHGVAAPLLQYARRDAERRPLDDAKTAFDYLNSRIKAIQSATSVGVVVYLSHHAGAWLDLLGSELRAQGVLT
ncbi:MAG: hypothetical protein ACREXT_14510, partial [Gammaproteobacteria bacterium]